MRIAISGACSMGKSTVVQDFLRNWSNYTEGKLTYKVQFKPHLHSTDIMNMIHLGNRTNQEAIRDSIIDDISKYKREDNVIFDRGLMDNLMYSLYLCGVGAEGCTNEWMTEQLPIYREAFKFYDLIFFVPLLTGYSAPIIPEGSLELDREVIFRSESDNIFKALQQQYLDGKRIWLPKEDTPALVELFGTPEERIQMIRLYINENGQPYGDDESLIKPHLPEALDLMQEMSNTK